MISLENKLFSKISYMHWLFWAIYQIKKVHGTSFYYRFSAYLFHKKCFLSNILLVLILEVVAKPVKALQLELKGFRLKPH